jgi:hypothetical protein
MHPVESDFGEWQRVTEDVFGGVILETGNAHKKNTPLQFPEEMEL